MRNRCRAFTLAEVIIALMALSMMVVIFGALYPLGLRMNADARNRSEAVAIAQKTLESVKFGGYNSLTYSSLLANGVIDNTKSSSPYSITSADSSSKLNPASRLPSGTGSLTVTDSAFDVKKVVVTVNWVDVRKATQTVSMSMLVANL